MNGTTELKVTTEADGNVIEGTIQHTNGVEICKSLCRMLVTTVAGIDDRDLTEFRSNQRSTFLRVAHGCDISIAGDNTDGICYTFALRGRRGVCTGKTQTFAAEIHHSGFKTQPGSGTRLVEKSSELLTVTGVSVFFRIFLDIMGEIHELIKLFDREVQRVH